MNKVRIIDLLNMISKGEEIPEKILYCNKIWYWDTKENDYVEDYKRLFNYYLDECLISSLNDEVEIIEDKEIEQIKIDDELVDEKTVLTDIGLQRNLIKLTNKINEIIDYINKEK